MQHNSVATGKRWHLFEVGFCDSTYRTSKDVHMSNRHGTPYTDFMVTQLLLRRVYLYQLTELCKDSSEDIASYCARAQRIRMQLQATGETCSVGILIRAYCEGCQTSSQMFERY
jgi:hypothetical protein